MTRPPQVISGEIVDPDEQLARDILALKDVLPPSEWDQLLTFVEDARIVAGRGEQYPYLVMAPNESGPAIAEVVRLLGKPVWNHPFSAGPRTAWGFETVDDRDAFMVRWGGVPRGKGIDFE